MKKLYWRPREVSRILLMLMAITSIIGFGLVENLRQKQEQPYSKEKLSAARLTEKAFKIVKAERRRQGIRLNTEFDPAKSGMIGPYISSVTTVPGTLVSKQTSANPNFSAVFIHYFKSLKLKDGDLVAIGYSGSFPALNIALLAAAKTMKLQVVAISSVGASGFGANMPSLLWIDMENLLVEKGLWEYRSIAASMGGIGDRGQGIRKKGRDTIRAGIARNNIPFIDTQDFIKGIDLRMQIYAKEAGDLNYKAYVNVGGGTLSVGTSVGKALYHPGLNHRPPPGALQQDSVMTRFMKQGVPVIHLVKIGKIATRFGLPLHPTVMPKPGEGKIFVREEYNVLLVLVFLVGILGTLFVFIRTEWGQRIIVSGGTGKGEKPPEPAV